MSEVSGEQATRRHRIARRALVPVTIVGLVALGATGWAAAASNGPTTPTPSVSVPPSPWTGHWTGHGNGWDGHWSGWSGWDGGGAQEALHGDCVSAKPGGGTQTTVFQRGR
jgi:hypothetical protein